MAARWGWYDAGAGIQWYCVPWDGGEPLVTAFSLMDAQAYTVPTPPEGAEVLGYDILYLDGMTVTEVSFRFDGLTWRYRMAATADVTENIPISRSLPVAARRRRVPFAGVPPGCAGRRAARAPSSGRMWPRG